MRIVITGAAGIIGQVLKKCLEKRYEVIGIDKKESHGIINLDILKQSQKLKNLLQSADVVIHLAWDTRENTILMEPILAGNKKMAELIFADALEQKVPKLIVASSVHAAIGHIRGYQYPNILKDRSLHQVLHSKKLISIADGFSPLGGYGASKVYLEALGRAYSSRGLQVIAVRFGNVTQDNSHGEYPFWLSHRDCCQFIEKCIITKNLPNFSTFFAISDNTCNPFDILEAKKYLRYKPKDGSDCPFKKNF